MKLRQFSFLVLIFSACLVKAADETSIAYVGTYTGQGSEGLYVVSFNPATGYFSEPTLAAVTDNPSFVAIDSKGRFLYVVNEMEKFGDQPTGAISVYSINRDSGQLQLRQQVSSLGAGPAHLSLDRLGHYLLVANYNSGNIAVFPIQIDGTLGESTAFIQHKGSSIHLSRQAGPHPHFIQTTPDNRFALVADLGLDQIMIYKFDPRNGTLDGQDLSPIKLSPGSGPRHFVFSPLGTRLYVLNELSSTIAAFDLEPASAAFHLRQTLSTLPNSFKKTNTAAEIGIDNAGQWLTVSNRGHDSLARIHLDPNDGAMTSINWVSSGGLTPRHFTFDPTGNWLWAAHQDSDDIHLFRVDPSSGQLQITTDTMKINSPVCVVFVPLHATSEVLISSEIAAQLPSAQEEVGNDPTVLQSRFELGDEYFNNSGGPDWHLATLRIDGAPTPKLAFRLDLPYMFLDPQGYPHKMDRGWADAMLRLSAVVHKNTRTGFTGICDFWAPTAESEDFGLGKFSAGPGVIAALMNPYKDMMVSALLQHKFSYGGDPARTDIDRTKFEIMMDKSIREKFWVVIDPVVYLDWVNNKRTAGVVEIETGARLGDHWSVWVRPGLGLWGQEVSGGYNSYCQAGFRYMFGKPIRDQMLQELRIRKKNFLD